MPEFSDTLVLLIANANIMQEDELEDAIEHAKALDLPVERAILMSGVVSEKLLQAPLRARQMVLDGKISMDQAVAAIRLVSHQSMTLDDALGLISQHQPRSETKSSSGSAVAVTSEIGQLLLTAKIVSPEQMERATKRAEQAAISVGSMLRLNRDVSALTLNSAINAQHLIRDNKAKEEHVIDALKMADKKQVSIEQTLFEMGSYQQPGDNELKISDLFSMAGLISESDRLECLELEVTRKQPHGQVLIDQGLVSHDLLETAVHLQGAVAAESIRPYQAADALKRVAKEKISVYQAIGEARVGPQLPPMRLGDLLVESGFATKEQIEKAFVQCTDTNVKIGKVLLQAEIISESKLFNTLRCQSLVKFGFISDQQAVEALKATEAKGCRLEDAFTSINVYAPTSMQWAWV